MFAPQPLLGPKQRCIHPAECPLVTKCVARSMPLAYSRLHCVWDGECFVVGGNVRISPPYRPVDCQLVANEPRGQQALEHVRVVVSRPTAPPVVLPPRHSALKGLAALPATLSLLLQANALSAKRGLDLQAHFFCELTLPSYLKSAARGRERKACKLEAGHSVMPDGGGLSGW